MTGREPHDVLGVDENASEEEIKMAYRRMVKRYHPDVSDEEDAEERFKRIRDAYDSLLEEGTAGRRTTPSGSSRNTDGRRENREERRSRQDRDGTDTTTPADAFEVIEEYADGWNLGVVRDGPRMGEWVVYRQTETVRPDAALRYLDESGDVRNEASYFGTRKQAETGHDRHAEPDRQVNRERGTRRRDAGRQNGSGGTSGATSSRGANIDTEKVDSFDSLWSLHHDGDRWAVVSETGGQYLDGSGGQRRNVFWFETRNEAEEAYEAYMEGAADLGGPSRNLTSGFGRSSDDREKERRERDIDLGGGSRRDPVSPTGEAIEAISSTVESVREFVRLLVGAPLRFFDIVLAPLLNLLSESPVPVSPNRDRFVGSVVMSAVTAFLVAFLVSPSDALLVGTVLVPTYYLLLGVLNG